jgi:hypothetical protein
LVEPEEVGIFIVLDLFLVDDLLLYPSPPWGRTRTEIPEAASSSQ